MKICIFCNSLYPLVLIEKLIAKNYQVILVFPDLKHQDILELQNYAQKKIINYIQISKVQLINYDACLMEHIQKSDILLTYTFPWLIPSGVRQLISKSVNIHFSLLPKYPGSDPVFWQIKNGESNCGVTFQYLSTNFDSGSIIYQYKLPIIPGENYGLLSQRLSFSVAENWERFMKKIDLNSKKNKFKVGDSFYRPKSQDITIHWRKMGAKEIENLVNACNPKYDGALTFINNQLVKILEVSPVDFNNPPIHKPGSIIYSDSIQGIFVLCCDFKVLKINIIKTFEGIFSGSKLSLLGYDNSIIFENNSS